MSNQEEKNIDIDNHNKQDDSAIELNDELSKVAVNPKQSMAIGISIAVIIAFLLFNFFFKDLSKKDGIVKPIEMPKKILKPEVQAPVLPTPPKIQAPTLPDVPLPYQKQVTEDIDRKPQIPLPPPLVPDLPSQDSHISLPSITGHDSDNHTKQKQKYKSAIMAIGGSATHNQTSTIDDKQDSYKIQSTDLSSVKNYTIISGKIIDAVLETAINSDTAAPQVRAVISRDVYSDSGKNILIPKGSRIYGSYSAGSSDGRVNIAWNQIYMFNGIILDLNATLVDNLGKSGQQGRYDPKNKEKFINSVMSTAFNILTAKGLDVLVPPTNNSQTQNVYQIFVSQINSAISRLGKDGATDNDYATSVCNTVNNLLMKDKDSNIASFYTGFTSACNAQYDKEKKYSAIKGALDKDNLSLLSLSTQTQSQIQQASSSGYKDLTNIIKTMLNQENLKATTSLLHGKNIKIYVNQTYVFPKGHLKKTRIVR